MGSKYVWINVVFHMLKNKVISDNLGDFKNFSRYYSHALKIQLINNFKKLEPIGLKYV